MDEKILAITSGAAKLFMKLGVKSVNMDDVAKHLGVSKKTLYKYFSDKSDLVAKAMAHHREADTEGIQRIKDKQLNAIDESFEIMQYVAENLRNMHPSIVFDMEKYYPQIMQSLREERNQVLYSCIYGNLERGKQEGLYRVDMHSDRVTKMYINGINGLFNEKSFPKEEGNLSDLYLELFQYHIHGISSEEGRRYFSEKIKEYQQ